MNGSKHKKQITQRNEASMEIKEVTLYKGPLPDPGSLEKYKEIYPDSVKIIFDMAKDYQDHIIKMDTDGAKAAKTDLWFSFILGIFGQIGVVCVCFLGLFFALLRPELAKAGFTFSVAVCGYLIWWKTKRQPPNKEKQ